MELKIMKRIICMVLALLFCMYLPMPAFAATNSPSNYWTCTNGHTGNTGNSCSVCGTLRPGTTTPQTGDTSMVNMWIIMMVVALVALVVAVVFFRRSKKA